MTYDTPIRRLAPSSASAALVDPVTRTFAGVFSNENEGRDGHIVRNSSLQTENYMANPVMPYGHDDAELPVAKAIRLLIGGPGEDSRVRFQCVPREIYGLAGVIEDMLIGGWLGALSMSWMPIEGTPRRGGGMTFTKVDVLEISIVQIPALADALIDARSRGIDTKPMYEWAERKLDLGRYSNRSELEAIARAASPARPSSRATTRAERAARARELQDDGKQQRLDKARRIVERISRDDAGLTKGDRMTTESEADNVRAARGHLARALKHHRELSGHHDDLAEQLTGLTEARRSLTTTLGELGIDDERVTRALNALDHCGRAIRRSHVAADDCADNAAGNVDRANDAICAIAPALK